MDWTEIKATVPSDKTDEAAAIANMTVPYGIYIEDYSNLEADALEIAHIDLIDEELISKNRENSVIHIYISECDNAAESLEFLKERFRAEGIPFEVGSQGVNDNDWNENWKKFFHTIEIGQRLAVVPSWEEYQNEQGRTVLSIDPGAAFGTGTHATTSLCLEILDKIVTPNKKVLISPFFKTSITHKTMLFTPEQHYEAWDEIFDYIGKDIDICAFQDGSAHMHSMSDYFRYTKKLCDKYDIEHWVNAETFERDVRQQYYGRYKQ